MPADLHIHTIFSDGTYSIEEVLQLATEKNLTFVSITDHDTVAGIEKIIDLAADYKVNVIAGVELSSVFMDEDIHLLGYGIDWKKSSFQSSLAYFKEKRIERFKEILRCLETNSIVFESEDLEVFKLENRIPGRVHLAELLVKKGYVSSVEEAFKKWLARGSPCFREKYAVSPFDQIRLIKEARGLAVLAHPGDYTVYPDLKSLVEAGLDGLEVFHPDHTPADVNYFLQLAKEYGLLVFGGSDAHGPGCERGYSIGTVVLDDSYLEPIIERLKIHSP
jgi:predicted metal-dependent phosphoesterase TrpH